MSADRADRAARRELAARIKYAGLEREVATDARREAVPLERAPANGEYRGRARVRVLPNGVCSEDCFSPQKRQARWWRKNGGK